MIETKVLLEAARSILLIYKEDILGGKGIKVLTIIRHFVWQDPSPEAQEFTDMLTWRICLNLGINFY